MLLFYFIFTDSGIRERSKPISAIIILPLFHQISKILAILEGNKDFEANGIDGPQIQGKRLYQYLLLYLEYYS